MAEWKRCKISDFGRVVTGKTPSTKVDIYWNGDVPFVTPGDLQQDKHIYSTARNISDNGRLAVKGASLPARSICVSCIGVLGYVGMTTKESVTNQQINSIIPSEAFDSDFVYYRMCSMWDDFKLYEGTSSVVSLLNKSTFSDIASSFPPLATQKKIAAVLGAIDDKIETNRKICANLEAQAQALFKSWFVDFEPFGGKMPNTWNQCVLEDVTENIRTRVGRENREVLSAVAEGKLLLSEEYFTKQVFSKSIAKYIVVDEWDFAYNPARINIGSIGVNDLGVSGCVSPVYVSFRVDKDYRQYFSLFFKTSYFSDQVKMRANGSVRQILTYDDFGKIPCLCPDRITIHDFNKIHDSFYSAIKHHKDESHALASMRDALLPRLMSGEIDVEKVEVA